MTVLPNDRDVLVALYHATGGPDWDRSDNCLTNAPLSEWYGVAVDSAGRVERLNLQDNGLSGPIVEGRTGAFPLPALSPRASSKVARVSSVSCVRCS